MDPFSSNAPNEPLQRDDTAFNPLAQATAIRESLSQLPGVASSVFSSFSSILKGTPTPERVEDAPPQYSAAVEPDQYQCFYDQSSLGQDSRQTVDIPPIAPAFYSPTDPNLARPEASLSPSTHDSNLYRLKERKKHYAQIPGLNANQLNAPASFAASAVPAAPAVQPLPPTPVVDQASAKANSSFSLSSFFGAPLLDKIQSTVLPKSDEAPNTYGHGPAAAADPAGTFATPFSQPSPQPPQQFIPFIQTDAQPSLNFGQPAPVPLVSPTAFNLSPYQAKATPDTAAAIAPLSAQLHQTHLSGQPAPAPFAPFVPAAVSPALTASPAPVVPPTNIAPPSTSVEPSNYRLRGKLHYKKPADYSSSPYQAAAYPNSAPLFNAPTVVPSALPPSVQIFNPTAAAGQPQAFSHSPLAPSSPAPIQLFNPATPPIAAAVAHPIAPPVEQAPPPPPLPHALFVPEFGGTQPSQFFVQSAPPIQLFNPAAPPTSAPAAPQFVAPGLEPLAAPLPPPPTHGASSAFAPVQPELSAESQPNQGGQPQFFEQGAAQDPLTPIQFFNPAAGPPAAGPTAPPFERAVQTPSLVPQAQLEPTTDDHRTHFGGEAYPHSAPSPIQLFSAAALPPANLFAPPAAEQSPHQLQPPIDDSHQPALFAEAPPQSAPSPIQLLNPFASSAASPGPPQAEYQQQPAHFEQFQQSADDSATFAEVPQQPFDPSPIQFFNPAEHLQGQPPFDPFQERSVSSRPQLFGASSPDQSVPAPIQLFGLASPPPPPPSAQTAAGHEQVVPKATPPPPPPIQLFSSAAPVVEQPHFEQFSNAPIEADAFSLLSTVADARDFPATAVPQLLSFFGPGGRGSIDTSAEFPPSIVPPLDQRSTDIARGLETFQAAALLAAYAEPVPLHPIDATPSDSCAEIELDHSVNTRETEDAAAAAASINWTTDSENNNQFEARRFSASEPPSEPAIDAIDVLTGSFVDTNANVEQQSLFNDPPPLSEVQKDEQDKNFNIIRTNLLNKRIESIAGVNRADTENTESLSIASVIVEPASSAQSEISEYATELIARSVGEPTQAPVAVSRNFRNFVCVCVIFEFIAFTHVVSLVAVCARARHRIKPMV